MEIQSEPLLLSWGRAVDGRFVIGLSAGQVGAMLHAFILSAEEEEALRSALTGILVAAPPPLRLLVPQN